MLQKTGKSYKFPIAWDIFNLSPTDMFISFRRLKNWSDFSRKALSSKRAFPPILCFTNVLWCTSMPSFIIQFNISVYSSIQNMCLSFLFCCLDFRFRLFGFIVYVLLCVGLRLFLVQVCNFCEINYLCQTIPKYSAPEREKDCLKLKSQENLLISLDSQSLFYIVHQENKVITNKVRKIQRYSASLALPFTNS